MDCRQVWLAGLLLAGIAATAAAGDRQRERAAVVQIGGCSGVIVDPAGLVMTAKHCDLSEIERVVIGDYEILAVRVYESPETEGPLVYDCVGSGYPWVPVAETVPDRGEPVHTIGYPLVEGRRQRREVDGVVQRGGRFRFRGEYFLGNMTDLPVSEGWSGGPLFSEQGEVIGLANAGDEGGSIFISHAATRAAWLAAMSLHSSRPRLLIATDLYCGSCLQFLGDYAGDAGFRREIQEHYRVVVVDVRAHPQLLGSLQDQKLPAFLIQDTEVTSGYSGKADLLKKLIHPVAVEEAGKPEGEREGEYH